MKFSSWSHMLDGFWLHTSKVAGFHQASEGGQYFASGPKSSSDVKMLVGFFVACVLHSDLNNQYVFPKYSWTCIAPPKHKKTDSYAKSWYFCLKKSSQKSVPFQEVGALVKYDQIHGKIIQLLKCRISVGNHHCVILLMEEIRLTSWAW